MKRTMLAVLLGLAVGVTFALADSDAARNAGIEYAERGGLSAREYHDTTAPSYEDEGCDQYLTWEQVQAKYGMK